MNELFPSQLSAEVMLLQDLIMIARQSSPDLWDSVASALNATDAALITSVTINQSLATKVTLAGDTTAASHREDYHG